MLTSEHSRLSLDGLTGVCVIFVHGEQFSKGWGMNRIVVIADDFTGAGDSGVHFARAGVKTAFLLNPEAIAQVFTEHDAAVVSTESRFMQPEEAAKIVYDFTLRCRHAGGEFFYKKVDSALRGNLGAETAAALRALQYPAALICTAMPKAGRTCVDGMLLLNGQPLHTTALGQDPFTPVRTSSVAECIAQQTDLRVGFIGLGQIAAGPESLRRRVRELLDEGCAVLVADAVTDEDLVALSDLLHWAHDPATALPPILPVGSGGLAKALAGPARSKAVCPQGRLLAVVGSLNGMALEQADFACGQKAYFPLTMDTEAGLADPERECGRLVRAAELAGEGNILLCGQNLPDASSINKETATKVADLYGRAVHALCRSTPFTAVFATGGSTAVAAAQALGLETVMLEDELLPGVVLSSCASPDTGVCWFISKAGSFGDRETLVAVADASLH